MKRKPILFASSAIMVALLIPMGLAIALPPRSAYAEPSVDARIEIVWPHDAQGNPAPVETAPLVNVEVYLFERGTLNPVACNFANRVILRWSRNFWSGRPGATLHPAHDVPEFPGAEPTSMVGQRLTRTVDGKAFPVWVFNDVPTLKDVAILQFVVTYLTVEVEGADARTNVWAHAADPRTSLPSLYPPRRGVAVAAPSIADALIAVVWPHDLHGNPRPVAEAPLVNVGVDLAEHPAVAGSADWRSVPASFGRPVRLLRSLNNGYLDMVKPADQVVTQAVTASGTTSTWPRWVFNDVDVSAARDPANKYYFAVQVEGITTHTTIWSHGADARTYFPKQDVPTQGCPN